jgi:hypothetical protein
LMALQQPAKTAYFPASTTRSSLRRMDTPTSPLDLLIDLEARHEDLLLRLDELDKRVEKALADCQVFRIGPAENPQNAEAA